VCITKIKLGDSISLSEKPLVFNAGVENTIATSAKDIKKVMLHFNEHLFRMG